MHAESCVWFEKGLRRLRDRAWNRWPPRGSSGAFSLFVHTGKILSMLIP